jgi:hydrogenase maturation protein HypF
VIKKMIDGKINSPLTSSVGRLFDAAGSLILSEDRAAFEAELPIKLEGIASLDCDDRYKFAIRSDGGMLVVEVSKLIKGIIDDLREKTDRGVMSAKFHNTIAEIASSAASRLRRRFGLDKVILSGGVFQNKYLTKKTVSILNENNFDVYVHDIVNTNDYGIPLGQLAIANVRPLCA